MKTFKTFEQLNVSEMILVKGGNSSSNQSRNETAKEGQIIYIDGKPYLITTQGLEPLFEA